MPTMPQKPMSGDGSTLDQSAFAKRSRTLLLWATLITLVLNFVPYASLALYPLRLFITFVHESGHALAFITAGGDVQSLQVHLDTSGVTYGHYGLHSAWYVLSGGYLGTTLFGALMLQLGRVRIKGSAGRLALAVMGIAVGVITLLWGFHPLTDPFTMITGGLISLGLLGLSRVLPPAGADFFAAFLAVQCSLNAIGDIRDLMTLTSMGHTQNDAVFMQQAYALPAIVWASIWAIVALGMLWFSLRAYLRATTKNAPKTV